MLSSQFTEINGDRLGVQNIGIVMTNGFDSGDSVSAALTQAAAARDAGVVIYSIGIGDGINATTLAGISSLPQQVQPSFYQTNLGQLSSLADPVVARTCVSSAESDCTTKVSSVHLELGLE